MSQENIERRRGRRAPIKAQALIRRLDAPATPPREHTTQNISLSGVYFETDQAAGLSLNDQILASVSIPEAERRTFPFARLAGRSRVVRIQELSATPGRDEKRLGIALEFDRDLTALTAIPT